MAKKPDLTVVKDFLFRYGERVGLFACIGLALLLLVMGFSGATGPGTPTGDTWDSTLKKSAQPINAALGRQADAEAIEAKKKEMKVEPIDWSRLDSFATPGAYINIGDKFEIGRNNPTILSVLSGEKNFQMDFIPRGYLGYEVKQQSVLALADAAGAAANPKGNVVPGGGNFGALQGGGGSDNGLCHVLKARPMLVVTGVFPMKQQVDEYVRALRFAHYSELITKHEMPIVLGINVAREEIAPSGKPTSKEPLPFIYYDVRKKPAALYVDPALNQELAEAIIDEANPHRYKQVIHEGLVTPLPKLPPGVSYPDIRVESDFMPKLADFVADNAEMPNGPPGAAAPGVGVAGVGGSKGSSGAKPPGILGNKGPQVPGQVPMNDGNTEPTPEVPTKFLKLDKLKATDLPLYTRLFNHRINIFHPLGQFPDTTGNDAASNVERFGFSALTDAGGATGPGVGPSGYSPPGMPGGPKGGSGGKGAGFPKPPPMGTDPSGTGGGAAAASSAITDAIVRFVDLDVKPGHRYRYYIQVRFQNPNYGKKNDVAQQLFADVKELVCDAPWTPTPEFQVPGNYHLFAVDQWRVDAMGETNQSVKNQRNSQKEYKDDGEHAVVQLHRYFGKTEGLQSYQIGDWAIVERLRLRKGEPIGSQEMIVEIPTWNNGKGAFEMRQTTPPTSKKGAKQPMHGVTLDFVPTVTLPDGKSRVTIAPLLVDFEGGKKANTKLLGSGVSEDAALDLLILMPDGRLVVRNSRADIDAKIDADLPTEATRQQRVEAWRKRNQDAINGGPAGGGNGPGGAAPILGNPK